MSEDNILDELEKFYQNNPIKVWVPSLQTECNFRPISVGEQKTLLDLENNKGTQLEYIVKSPQVLNALIMGTCLEPDKAEQFTIIDRPAILLQLKHNVKEDIVLRINEELAEVSLKQFVDKLPKKKLGKLKLSTMVNVHNFLVHLRVPTLAADEFYNGYFLSLYEGQEDVDLESATGDAFIAEMSKFIRKIVFETSEKPEVFDFDDTSMDNFNRNMELLGRLPSTVVTRVTEFISRIKEYQVSLVTEKIAVNGKSKNIFLDIDLPFFTTL